MDLQAARDDKGVIVFARNWLRLAVALDERDPEAQVFGLAAIPPTVPQLSTNSRRSIMRERNI